ncbi:MAG: transketolase [candidate division Zixibacteria bacterium]|nr:transketolase [candidate division Zixibacteria bacterium]
MSEHDLEQRCINTIRMLAVDAVQQANSGHPGLPMEAAPIAYVLWTRLMRYNPKNPDWPNRDRFVLSGGHGSMLLYAMLHLTGYDLSLDEIRNFRQWESQTPGHPEYGDTPGVETTTGPLGQGIANAVGMAMAEAHLAARYNRPGHEIVNHYTYVIASDGDMMEGVASEACSLAGHLGLGKLIVLYLDNSITIDGGTDLAFSENTGLRFDAYGWHVQRVMDGNDLARVEAAVEMARNETDRPSVILCRTVIGYGSPNKAGTSKAHGEPLGEEEVELTKQSLGWPLKPKFLVPEDVRAFFQQMIPYGKGWELAWRQAVDAYAAAFPELAETWKQTMDGELPAGWDENLPTFSPDQGDMATRQASGVTINALSQRIPGLLGGSADLAGSNNTMVEAESNYAAGNYAGRNLHFGVREHAMASALNGMTLHGGLRPYAGTFLVFSDYMRPAIRLAALMGIAPVYVFTHDSVGLGEDGPTHQPIEHYMALRAIPNLTLIRPADAAETAEAWLAALRCTDGPVALVLTRQKLPVLDREGHGAASGTAPAEGLASSESLASGSGLAPADGLHRGAYILADADGTPDVILIASGSEVHLALEARETLAGEGVAARVVSMPSWELFEAQTEEYRESVLPSSVTARLAVEPGVTLGWERYVGPRGDVIGLERFGASAPYQDVFEHLGFTAENIAGRAKALVAAGG